MSAQTATKMPVGMTPELALALESGVKAALKEFMKGENPRDQVAPDQTLEGVKIDMILEVGTVKIGHETDKAPTASIPLLPTLALLVRKMGFQRDKALEMLKEAMQEAINLDKSAAKALLAEAGVAEAEKLVKSEVISKLPRTKVAKSVKAKDATLTVTGVSQSA